MEDNTWMESEEAMKARVALMLNASANDHAKWPLQCMATTAAKKRCSSKGKLHKLECGREVRLCKLHSSLACEPDRINSWPVKSNYELALEKQIAKNNLYAVAAREQLEFEVGQTVAALLKIMNAQEIKYPGFTIVTTSKPGG